MSKMHDADLCERIRELEERVRELEARPDHHYCNHWPVYYPQYPQWTYTPWVSSGTSTTIDSTPTVYSTSTIT